MIEFSVEKQTVLFICTHNSARSQMAEGLVNHFFRDRFQAFSAGTKATQVNPYAIQVLQEWNIDITHHRSKSIDQFLDNAFDLVVTVCDSANESCPYFPNAHRRYHQNFSDPSIIEGPAIEKLQAFITARDEIYRWLQSFLNER